MEVGMARIPEEEIARLKASVSLAKLVQARGVELRRVGKDLVGRCPLHEGDSDPSLHVTEGEPDLFHCFGCGAGGDALSWLQKTEGNISFRHAVELLRGLAGEAGELPRGPLRRRGAALELSADDEALLEQVMGYYHERLKSTPAALEYLEKRGIGSPELIEHFALGYSDRTLCYSLAPKKSKAGAELRGRLQQLGILRESGHELFWGAIVVPIRDENGRLVSAYGRKTGENLREGTAYHLNLDGKLRGVFNARALLEHREIILTEAVIDALSFWAAGFKNVVACRGAGNFTEEMLACFVRCGVRRVFVGFDPDEAGEKGARSAAERLRSKGIECLRVEFPAGLDAADFALRYAPAERAFARLLEAARPMGGGAAEEREAPGSEAERERAEKGPQAAAAAKAEKAQPEPRPAAASFLAASAADAAAPDPPPLAERQPAPDPPPLAERRPAPDPPPLAERRPAPDPPPLAERRPAPDPPRPALSELRQDAEALELVLGERTWRVRGLEHNCSLEQLRVQLSCARGEAYHLDRLDLYSASRRQVFIKQAAAELGVPEAALRTDMGKLLRSLEELHEQKVREAMRPKEERVELSAEQEAAALGLLRDPRLLSRVLADFERTGVVGERLNKLVGYLALVSRKLEQPLGILIQSSSAAGKSSLMNALLVFMPKEEQVQYSAMTGQALYYMGEKSLAHKILAIAEEQGAQRASYALKLLLSEGKLSIASTGKDPHTGKLVTHEYEIEGPVMLILTTTAIELDEELLNRCLVLCVDEGREQTRAIHELQRLARGLDSLWAREERAELLDLHQNAQRLLRPLSVINPFAHRLTFLDDRTRTRRDHLKYLTLIDAIALLHQHQRPVRSARRGGAEKQYIEATLEDVELATLLAHVVLGRTLDELAPQTRRFASLLDEIAREECERLGLERSEWRFTQRDVRERTGWSDFQVKTHLRKLQALEYVLAHRSGRGQSFVYELLYGGEGQDGRPFLMGLIDTSKLRRELGMGPYDGKWEHLLGRWVHPESKREHPGSAQGAPREHPGSSELKADDDGPEAHFSADGAENAYKEPVPLGASYPQAAGRNGRGGRARAAGGL
jgi:DNA primase